MVEDTEGKESLKKALERISKVHEITVAQIKTMERPSLEVIPSGSYALDHALGVGGYPRGRIIEMFGQPSGGKSTLSLLAIASVQKNGGVAALVDTEHAFSAEWAEKLGVKVDDLIFVQPDSGEQALQIVEDLVKTDQVDLVIIDSVAGLIPKSEIEGELGAQTMGVQARMLSTCLRRLTGSIGKSKSVVIFINQLRAKLGSYVPTFTTPGGESLKFYSSLRIEVKKLGQSEIKDGDDILGHRVEAKLVKNKVAPPFRKAEFTLRFLEGVDRVDELVTLGLKLEIIEQAGPTYKFGEISAKGREKLMEIVNGDVKVQEALWKAIQEYKK